VVTSPTPAFEVRISRSGRRWEIRDRQCLRLVLKRPHLCENLAQGLGNGIGRIVQEVA
jgi:hypothetical protein